MKAITLFSSGGIGDLAIKACGVRILVANELLEVRAKLHESNFPETEMICGDIWVKKDQIVDAAVKSLAGEELDFVFATPPCQGMSKNGQGKLLRGIRDGQKPKFDKRNQLIIPTLDIIKTLRPKTVFFENVPEMVNTFILDKNGDLVNIIDHIEKELGDEYIGRPEIVQFADHGVPQRRSRLITIYTREPGLIAFFKQTGTFIPAKTHSKSPTNNVLPWVTLRETIFNLPKLDGKLKETAISKIPFHYVPVLDPKKYTWISNTPPEKGAFDNQCNNPECMYDMNSTHGASHDHNGVNRANGDTPLYCEKCGVILPRPYTIKKDGTKRIMAGFTSAYKRMSWSKPSPTLTTNLSYPSSDHKLHPDQHRVLSLYEAFRLHTLDKFEYNWVFKDGSKVPDTAIREVIGESIPPLAIQIILKNIVSVLENNPIYSKNLQLSLTC
jgi:DNA (cytosine-5)-methyltransferase 1